MALDNIQLNALLVTELYRNSIVAIRDDLQKTSVAAEPRATRQAPNSDEWKYLGGGKRNILLIVSYPNAPFLPDGALNFLTSVLEACKVGLSDVAILNIANTPSASYKDVQTKFRPAVAILFGISPRKFEMPLDFPEFQVQSFNHCTFLYAPVLESLESDQLLKSKLWVCLRKIFNLT